MRWSGHWAGISQVRVCGNHGMIRLPRAVFLIPRVDLQVKPCFESSVSVRWSCSLDRILTGVSVLPDCADADVSGADLAGDISEGWKVNGLGFSGDTSWPVSSSVSCRDSIAARENLGVTPTYLRADRTLFGLSLDDVGMSTTNLPVGKFFLAGLTRAHSVQD
jgi:hypothetical protein